MDISIREVKVKVSIKDENSGRYMSLSVPAEDYFKGHPDELKELIIRGLSERKKEAKSELEEVKEDYKTYKLLNSTIDKIAQSEEFKKTLQKLSPKQRRTFRRKVKNALLELVGVSEDYLMLTIESCSKRYRYYQALTDIFKKMDADSLIDLLPEEDSSGGYDD